MTPQFLILCARAPIWQEGIAFITDYAGPGYYNDLDMMIVGNMSKLYYNGPSALTLAETKAHIALWAILKSPLLLSCDVRSLSPEVCTVAWFRTLE